MWKEFNQISFMKFNEEANGIYPKKVDNATKTEGAIRSESE